MGVANNYSCYWQLYRFVPAILHLFSNFIQFVSVLFTPLYLLNFFWKIYMSSPCRRSDELAQEVSVLWGSSSIQYIVFDSKPSIYCKHDYCCTNYFGGQVAKHQIWCRSSTEYDAGQAVKALFERSKILTAVVVVSTGPIGMTPPCCPCTHG